MRQKASRSRFFRTAVVLSLLSLGFALFGTGPLSRAQSGTPTGNYVYVVNNNFVQYDDSQSLSTVSAFAIYSDGSLPAITPLQSLAAQQVFQVTDSTGTLVSVPVTDSFIGLNYVYVPMGIGNSVWNTISGLLNPPMLAVNDGRNGPNLFTLDKTTGQLQWIASLPGTGNSGSAIAISNDGTMIYSGDLYAHSVRTLLNQSGIWSQIGENNFNCGKGGDIGKVSTVKVSPGGDLLAVALNDRTDNVYLLSISGQPQPDSCTGRNAYPTSVHLSSGDPSAGAILGYDPNPVPIYDDSGNITGYGLAPGIIYDTDDSGNLLTGSITGGMAFSKDGYLVVANNEQDSISLIDPYAGAVLQTIALPNDAPTAIPHSPIEVLFDKTGQFVFVSCRRDLRNEGNITNVADSPSSPRTGYVVTYSYDGSQASAGNALALVGYIATGNVETQNIVLDNLNTHVIALNSGDILPSWITTDSSGNIIAQGPPFNLPTLTVLSLNNGVLSYAINNDVKASQTTVAASNGYPTGVAIYKPSPRFTTVKWPSHTRVVRVGQVLGATELDAVGSAPVTLQYTTNAAQTDILTGSASDLTTNFSFKNVGTYTVTATLPSTEDFVGSSKTTTIQVIPADTTVTLSSTANPSVYGQGVSFTAKVAVTAPGGGSPTGTLNFYLDTSATPFYTVIGFSGSSVTTGPWTSSTLAGFTPGSTHTITASYSPSTAPQNYNASSALLSQTVNLASTATSISSSANPSIYGNAVTFTATVAAVAPGAGTPTGTVTFSDGSTTLGTGTLSSGGIASFTTSTPLTGGAHTITASYGGDANLAASSATLSQTVNRAATTTGVVSSLNPSVFGQTVTFTATVSGGTAGTPTGTVTFSDGSTTLGTGTLSGGIASFTTTTLLTVGAHTITAGYGGDANFSASSSTLTQTVNKAATTTGVVSSLNPSVFGQTVTFTATVSPTTTGMTTPTGTVQFSIDGGALAPVSLVGGVATLSSSTLTGGTHTITAVYSGDGNYLTSTAPSLNQTVNKASTSTAVTSSSNPSSFGQTVTFTAKVSSSSGVPSGTVQFTIDGATTPVSVDFTGGVAKLADSALAVGTHTVTAVYVANANYSTSTGALSPNQVVNKAATSTAVTSSANPSTFGQNITLTATVSGGTAGTPTGTVTFNDGSTQLGTGTLSGGIATFTTTTPPTVGSHAITAGYGGDANFSTSTGTLTQTVNKASTTTSVASSTNPSVLGQNITLTATVSGGAVGTPTGTVTFSDGSTQLGTGTLSSGGIATFTTTTPLTVGAHTITASYGGDANFSTSSGTLTQTVNKASTTTSVTSSINPSVFGQSTTLTATVSGGTAGTPTGTVTFSDGSTTLGTGTLSGGIATFPTTTPLTVGAHTITAGYGGDANFIASSGTLTQTVTKASTTTSVASSINPSVFGQSTILTATVSGGTAGTPTGTVTFSDGTTTLGTGTLSSGGTASLTTTTLTVGAHTITASYGGDANFTASNGTLTQTVTKASTTTSVTSSMNPSALGQTITLSATVSGGTAGTPTGAVTFSDGTTALGTGTLSNSGIATFTTTTPLAVGAHGITASYGGDANFTASSGTLTQTVNKASTTTSVASSMNPSVLGQNVTLTATVSGGTAGTPTGTVTFSDGSTQLGTGTISSGGIATFTTTTPLTVGAHAITAGYGGDANFTASSGTLTQTVNKASTTTSVTSSINPSVFGQSTILTATVSGGTVGTPTGSVTFSDGSTTLGTGTLSSSGIATFTTTTPLTVGAHTITAGYGGDANFTASSGTLTQTVTAASTTTSVVSSINPSVFGQSTILTATVSGGAAGTPTGTVTFSDGSTALGTGTLSGGIATYTTTTSLAVGAHTITAGYGGDANFTGSSGTLTQTVTKASTTTSVASSINPSAFGQSITLTATVSGGAAGTPTGTVTFSDGTTALGTGTLSSSGIATFTTSTPLTLGAHTIAASYGGDANFIASSGTLIQTVNKAPTTTSVTSSINPSVLGQTVTLTATVSGGAAGTPTGAVTFSDGSTQLGTGTLSSSGIATFTTTTLLTVGAHGITASYGGDANFNASSGTLTQTVTKAPTTTSVASSINPSILGQNVTLTATVSGGTAGTPTGTVTFSDGSTSLGAAVSLSNGVATLSTTALTAGTHSITAVYSGDTSFLTSTSTALSQVVNKVSTSTAVSSSLNPSNVGQSVTFTATVSPSVSGVGTPTGTVQFYDGATALGAAVSLSNGVATLSTTALTAGTHSITAVYSGDANFLTSTSTALSQVVTKISTSTAVSSSLNPSNVAQSVTFTATVTAGAGTPTGTIQFYDGATALGAAVSLSNRVATLSTTALTAGTHPITAVYSGDTSFFTSTSTALSQVVNAAATTTTVVVSSFNPSVFGKLVVFTATVTPGASGLGTPTGTVTFKDGSTTLGTAAVSASGTASFSTAALSVGVHSITAVYGGDVHFTGSTSSVLNQTVNKRATIIVYTGPSTMPFGIAPTLTAKLTDDSGSPLAGEAVTFTIGGIALLSATTDSTGVAQAVPTLAQMLQLDGLSVSSYTVNVSFAGDLNYLASSSTGNVLQILTCDVDVTGGGIGDNNGGKGGFVVDSELNGTIKGELQYQNNSTNFHAHIMTALGTSCDGKSAWFAGKGDDGRSFVAYVEDNGEPGLNDKFRIWINGVVQNDGTLNKGNIQIHESCSCSGTPASTKTSTVLTYTGDTAESCGTGPTLSATLTTSSGKALAFRSVTFTINGATLTDTTDCDGIASVTGPTGLNAGAYPVNVSFVGDKYYAPSATTATLTVSCQKKSTTLTYTGDTTETLGTAPTLTATLTDSNGSKLRNYTVTFTINGVTLTDVTDNNGIASVAGPANLAAGLYPINVSFAGNSTYAPSSTSAQVLVSGKPTVLTYTGTTTKQFGFDPTLAAKLTDKKGSALVDRTVTFVINNISQSDQTDSNGVASVPTPSQLMPGSYPVSVSFAGDSNYQASSTTGVVLQIVNSSGSAVGSGFKDSQRNSASFSVAANSKGVTGKLQYGTYSATTMTALGISQDGKSAWFAGVGKDGRKFVAYAEDTGEWNKPDELMIWIDGALQNNGSLQSGNNQIYQNDGCTDADDEDDHDDDRGGFHAGDSGGDVYDDHGGHCAFSVKTDDDGNRRSGSFQYQNNSTNFHCQAINTLGVSQDGSAAWISGIGDDGRKFVAYVEDNSTHGKSGKFLLWINGIQQNNGAVQSGKIQIHQKSNWW